MFLYGGKEGRGDLLPALLRVLEDFNGCDLRLYEAMLERFERQLQLLALPHFLT